MKPFSPGSKKNQLFYKKSYSKHKTGRKILNKRNLNKNNNSQNNNYDKIETLNQKNGIKSSPLDQKDVRMNIGFEGSSLLSLKERFLQAKQAQNIENSTVSTPFRMLSSERLLDMLITKKKLERLEKENYNEGTWEPIKGGVEKMELNDVEVKNDCREYNTRHNSYLASFKSEQILAPQNNMSRSKNYQTHSKNALIPLRTTSEPDFIPLPSYIKCKVEMTKQALEVLQGRLDSARKADAEWNKSTLFEEDSLKQRSETNHIPYRPITPHLPTLNSFRISEFYATDDESCDNCLRSSSYLSFTSSSTIPTINLSLSSNHIQTPLAKNRTLLKKPKVQARTKLSTTLAKSRPSIKKHRNIKKKGFFEQNDSYETIGIYSDVHDPSKRNEDTSKFSPTLFQNSLNKLVKENVIEFSGLLDKNVIKQPSNNTVNPSFPYVQHTPKHSITFEQGDNSKSNINLEQPKSRNLEIPKMNNTVVAKKRHQFLNNLPNNVEHSPKNVSPLFSLSHKSLSEHQFLPIETLSQLTSTPPKPSQRFVIKKLEQVNDNLKSNSSQKDEEIEIIENFEDSTCLFSKQGSNTLSSAIMLPDTPKNRGMCNNNDNVYVVSQKNGKKTCCTGYCDPPPYTGTLPRGCIPPCTIASCAVNPCGIFFDTVPLDPYQRCLDRINNLRCLIREDCVKPPKSSCGNRWDKENLHTSMSSLITANTKDTEGSNKQKTDKDDASKSEKSKPERNYPETNNPETNKPDFDKTEDDTISPTIKSEIAKGKNTEESENPSEKMDQKKKPKKGDESRGSRISSSGTKGKRKKSVRLSKASNPDVRVPKGTRKRSNASVSKGTRKRSNASVSKGTRKRSNASVSKGTRKRSNASASKGTRKRSNASVSKGTRKRSNASVSKGTRKRSNASVSKGTRKRSNASVSKGTRKRSNASVSKGTRKRSNASVSKGNRRRSNASLSKNNRRRSDASLSKKNRRKSDTGKSKGDLKASASKANVRKKRSQGSVGNKSGSSRKGGYRKSQDSVRGKTKRPSNVGSTHFFHDEQFYKRLVQMFQQFAEGKISDNVKSNVEKEISIEKIEKALRKLEEKKNLKIFFPSSLTKKEEFPCDVNHVQFNSAEMHRQPNPAFKQIPNQPAPKIEYEPLHANVLDVIDSDFKSPDAIQEFKPLPPHFHYPQTQHVHPVEIYNEPQTSLWKRFLCTQFCKPYKKGVFYRQAENLPPSECHSSKTSIRQKFKVSKRKRQIEIFSSNDEKIESIDFPPIDSKVSKTLNKKLKKLSKLMAEHETTTLVSSEATSKPKDSVMEDKKIKHKTFDKKNAQTSDSSEQKMTKISKKKKKQSSEKITWQSSVTSNQTSLCLNKALNVQKHCKKEIKKTEEILKKIMEKKGLVLENNDSKTIDQVSATKEIKINKPENVEKTTSSNNVSEKNMLENVPQKQNEAQDDKMLSTSFFQLLKDFIKSKLSTDTEQSTSQIPQQNDQPQQQSSNSQPSQEIQNNENSKEFSTNQTSQEIQHSHNSQFVPNQINNNQKFPSQASQQSQIQMPNNQLCCKNIGTCGNQATQHTSITDPKLFHNTSELERFANTSPKLKTYPQRKLHQNNQTDPIQTHNTYSILKGSSTIPNPQKSQPPTKFHSFDLQRPQANPRSPNPRNIRDKRFDLAKIHQKQTVGNDAFFRPSAPNYMIPRCFQHKVRNHYDAFKNFPQRFRSNSRRKTIKKVSETQRYITPQRRKMEKVAEAYTQTDKAAKGSTKLFKDQTCMTYELSKKKSMEKMLANKKLLEQKNSDGGKEKAKLKKKSSEILITIKNKTNQERRKEQEIIKKIIEYLHENDANQLNPKKKISLTSLYKHKKRLVQEMLSIDWNLSKLQTPHVSFNHPFKNRRCVSAFDDIPENYFASQHFRPNYMNRSDNKFILDLMENTNVFLLDDRTKRTIANDRYNKQHSIVTSGNNSERRTINTIRAPFLALKRGPNKVFKTLTRKKNFAIIK